MINRLYEVSRDSLGKNNNIHFINKQPKIEVDQNPLKNQ